MTVLQAVNSRRRGDRKNIAVCVCTYRRPVLLRRLLLELQKQETGGLFDYSIIVVDNDDQRSAEDTVNEVKASSRVPIVYCNEPRQNIARARNKAVEVANGEL